MVAHSPSVSLSGGAIPRTNSKKRKNATIRINHITVNGLFGVPGSATYSFNNDLNILTGRNGSGKTTIIKLAWSIISGNILLALREINFKSCVVVTNEYSCTVIRTGPAHCKIEMEYDGERHVFEDDVADDPDSPFAEYGEYAEDKATPIIISKGSSIFFPTFRRIEGGFSITPSSSTRTRPGTKSESDLEDSLVSISRKLSNKEHLFVAAISDVRGPTMPVASSGLGGRSRHVLIRKFRYHRRHVTNALFLRRCARL
jgi:hypothetical protein